MAKPKVHPDALHNRRLEARFVAALLLGLGIGTAWVGWRLDLFWLTAVGAVVAAVGAAWPRWAQTWLERKAGGGKLRCLHCGMRRSEGSTFCQECGWRAPEEERVAKDRRKAWEEEH